jgi:hypothetical protein
MRFSLGAREESATAIAAVGLGSLLSSRLLRDVLDIPTQVDDQSLVDTWVGMMSATIGGGGSAGEASGAV